jgi:predicted PurR-regulated permease PerM
MMPSGTAERDPSPDAKDAPDTTAAPTGRLQTRAVLRVILIVLAVAGLLWTLYLLEGVILLIVISILFAYVIAPLVEIFRRPIMIRGRARAMPRVAAIGAVYLLFFVGVGTAMDLLLPRLASQVTQFAEQAPTYLAYARERLQAGPHLFDPDRLPPAVRDPIDNAVSRTMESLGGHLTGVFTGLLGLLSHLPWLVLIPILTFFLLKDADSFRSAALQALPRGRLRWRGADVLRDVNSTLAAYIRAQLLACLLVGVVCTIGFLLIGVRYALVLGVAAGLLEFIPLVGPLVVAGFAALVSGFDSLGQALLVLAFLAILRIVQDYVIYPRLIRHGVHLHPLAVILGIVSGAEVAGVVGIFLAIPIIAVFSVLYRHWLAHTGSPGVVGELLKPAVQTTADPPVSATPLRGSGSGIAAAATVGSGAAPP